jgi:hypothetical protein
MFFIRYYLVVTNSAIIQQSIAYCSPLGVCAWLVPRERCQSEGKARSKKLGKRR